MKSLRRSSHAPPNPACAAIKGFKLITIYPDKNGRPDLEAMKAAVNERTAALFITNRRISVFTTEIFWSLPSLSTASEGFAATTRPMQMLCWGSRAHVRQILISVFSISTRHSPPPTAAAATGCGVVGVKELVPYLPAPLVGYNEKGESLLLGL